MVRGMREGRPVRLRRTGWLGLAVVVACATARVPVLGKDPTPFDTTRLDGISAYVESYYGRAQSLMVDETSPFSRSESTCFPTDWRAGCPTNCAWNGIRRGTSPARPSCGS